MSKTIFIDIDGVIFKHSGGISKIKLNQELLPGVKESFDKFQEKAYNVIIVTGRPESHRNITILQLMSHGLAYDQLIMGLKRFRRILINDVKPDGKDSATAINLERDKGMEDLDV